ncbi:MAG: biopolymer transporter ExbD [Planctomycetota bacterium]|nr:biopolymer transporter ExbD [Planctomycetota bacterium]
MKSKRALIFVILVSLVGGQPVTAEEAQTPEEAQAVPAQPELAEEKEPQPGAEAKEMPQVAIERGEAEKAAEAKPEPAEKEEAEKGAAPEAPAPPPAEEAAKPAEPKPDAKAAAEAKKEEQPPPAEPVKPAKFGFEGIGAWRAAAWADGIELSETPEPRQEGEKALRLRVNRPKQGKAAIGLDMPLRLADYGTVALDVYLESEKNYPVLLTLGLVVGDHNLWVESTPRLLQKGWNQNLRFALYENEWKTEATKWRYCTSAQGKGEARSIHLLFHGLDYGESVVVDNLVFLPAEAGAKVPPEAKLAEVNKITAAVARKRETEDLSRADAIRAYALSALADYATDLAAAGQAADANRLAEIVAAAEKAPLVARALPAPAPQEPGAAAAPKPAEAEAKPEKAASAEQTALPSERLLISIPKRGAVKVEGEEARRGTLAVRLKELLRQKGDRPVTIRVEADVPLAKISEVEEACREAGFTAVSIEQQ